MDSILIDLSNYYSKEEFVNMTSPYVSFISICGYDFNGQNDDVGWNQSPLFFQYLNKKYEVVVSEQTGFVENSINFWMHPPRQDKFMQNYTAPWPMVVYNKSQWNWSSFLMAPVVKYCKKRMEGYRKVFVHIQCL